MKWPKRYLIVARAPDPRDPRQLPELWDQERPWHWAILVVHKDEQAERMAWGRQPTEAKATAMGKAMATGMLGFHVRERDSFGWPLVDPPAHN